MKKGKLGFTLIEVAIFLAITGALFVGVAAGVQNSISQQRYNDAVQNFMEFLRTTYSEVSNVQSSNVGGGRSEKAIYGKMVTFGETYDLAGNKINSGDAIFSYTVIGNVGNSESGSALQLLNDLKANVVVKGGSGQFETAGIAESYTPRWAAQVEVPCDGNNCSYTPFKGTILIVRHPSSGTVYTFYNPTVIEVNKKIREANRDGATSLELFKTRQSGRDVNYLTNGSFEIKQVDFCVNQNPGVAGMRGDVRIMAGARNASGVEMIAEENGVCMAR